MMSQNGCTCYDETTRKCPIKGHPERQSMQKPTTNLFHHFRGGVYFVITRGKHTETNEDMVAYAGTGNGGSEGIWFRPATMFDGLYCCRRCDKTWPRFTRCGEPQAEVCDCPPFEECTRCGGWGSFDIGEGYSSIPELIAKLHECYKGSEIYWTDDVRQLFLMAIDLQYHKDQIDVGFDLKYHKKQLENLRQRAQSALDRCSMCEGTGIVDLPVPLIFNCIKCGGTMTGEPLTCENREPLDDVEPDSGPWSCDLGEK